MERKLKTTQEISEAYLAALTHSEFDRARLVRARNLAADQRRPGNRVYRWDADGTTLLVTPTGGGDPYRVNGVCPCKDFAEHGMVWCKHRLLRWLEMYPDNDPEPQPEPEPEPAADPSPLARLTQLWAEQSPDLVTIAHGDPSRMWGVFSADLLASMFHERDGSHTGGVCGVCDMDSMNGLALATLRKVQALHREREWQAWVSTYPRSVRPEKAA
jgi:hypothetical protein